MASNAIINIGLSNEAQDLVGKLTSTSIRVCKAFACKYCRRDMAHCELKEIIISQEGMCERYERRDGAI